MFKFPCTMGEDIRIFHIEIIYLIGGNITAVIVIILTKSTFELLDQLIPEITDASARVGTGELTMEPRTSVATMTGLAY